MNAHMNQPTVIVVGGGYAGAMAANRLQGSGTAAVTMVSPDPEFVERIRLHQLAAGTGSATVGYDTVLHPDIRRVVAAAERIDAAAQTVTTSDGTVLGYDMLVYAVGSGAGVATIPGAAEFAYPLAELADARRLSARVAQAPTDASIVVVGGGLTGVEVAAEMAQARPAAGVTLVCGGRLVASAGTRGRGSVARRLRRLHIDIIENAPVDEVTDTKVVLADGRVIAADITITTAGFAVPELASQSGLSTDADGRLMVDSALISVDDPHIVGAGDAVSVAGTSLRMSCQSALPLGAQAANTIRSLLAGETPAAVDQGFAAQCIGLGRSAATVVATHRDDRPRGVYVGGRAGALIKEQVCRMTLRWISGEARRADSYSWPAGGHR